MKIENKQPDFIPGFDAVAESRKWKEAVGRETAGMSTEEVVAYFKAAGERYFAERREWERKNAGALALAH